MSTIKLEIELRPAHILGKKHSTTATLGALRVTENTKAAALAAIELDAIAVLRHEPYFAGGEVTGRVYALQCQGAERTPAGVVEYSWMITILDPRADKDYKHSEGHHYVCAMGCGGMGFSRPTEGEARKVFFEYIDSCEAAHAPAVNTGS